MLFRSKVKDKRYNAFYYMDHKAGFCCFCWINNNVVKFVSNVNTGSMEEVVTRPHKRPRTKKYRKLWKGKHTMKSLHQIASERLGPYNVATANCHHAALAVFNDCVVTAAQVTSLPNSELVAAARFLQIIGIDVVHGSDC